MMLGRLALPVCRRFSSVARRGEFWKETVEYAKYEWFEKHATRRSASYIYETAVDGVDYKYWMDNLSLEDDFLTWFSITEIHVWMCLLRGNMFESEFLAKKFRDILIKLMWMDVEERVGMIGRIGVNARRVGVQQCAAHFKFNMALLDEAIQNDDRLLATALWRNLYKADPNFEDFQSLRALVHYVRRNVSFLEELPHKKFMANGGFEWKPIQESFDVAAGKKINS